MNPEDVGRILDEIGERIGPAGEYAWQLTVRQVVIEGVAWIVIGGVFVLLTLLCLFLGFRRQPDDEGAQITLALFAFMGLCGAVATGAIKGIELLNPEYHAIIRLLQTVVPR